MGSDALIDIRRETAGDRDAIRRVVVEAFRGSELGHNGEAELIDALRAELDDHLSLVASLGDEVVGQIMFTTGDENFIAGKGISTVWIFSSRGGHSPHIGTGSGFGNTIGCH